MNNSFLIFIKSNRLINPTKGNILFLIMIICIIISVYFGKNNDYTTNPLVLSMLAYFFYRETEFTRFQYLNGRLKGTLVFNETDIIIDERKIDISEIQKIHLKMDDYEGYQESFSRYYFSTPMSNGTNNRLVLNLKTKEIIKVSFKMEYEEQCEDLKPFVISLLQYEIITIDEALEILKIDDNYFIDKFKLELNKKEPE